MEIPILVLMPVKEASSKFVKSAGLSRAKTTEEYNNLCFPTTALKTTEVVLSPRMKGLLGSGASFGDSIKKDKN